MAASIVRSGNAGDTDCATIIVFVFASVPTSNSDVTLFLDIFGPKHMIILTVMERWLLG